MERSWRLLMLLAATTAGGCATTSEQNPDPLETVNRAIYRVNDVGDRYIARPIADGYRSATPSALRRGVGNALSNLRYPITIVNALLQGKLKQGGADAARFLVNSTIGLGGLFDPADTIGLRENDEDFGQTLVVWGVPEGPYLMLPLFGPYTLTSGIGDLAGTPISLLTTLPESDELVLAWGGYLIHRRAGLIGADDEIRQAFDPYIFVRDAYLQNRRYKIYDGDVPEDDLYLEDESLDDSETQPDS